MVWGGIMVSLLPRGRVGADVSCYVFGSIFSLRTVTRLSTHARTSLISIYTKVARTRVLHTGRDSTFFEHSPLGM